MHRIVDDSLKESKMHGRQNHGKMALLLSNHTKVVFVNFGTKRPTMYKGQRIK